MCTYISLTNCITGCFKITLTLNRARYFIIKDVCVAEPTAIFQDPKDLLDRIFLITKGAIPISDGLKKEWGCMYVLAHVYEKLQGIQFDFVQIILFAPFLMYYPLFFSLPYDTGGWFLLIASLTLLALFQLGDDRGVTGLRWEGWMRKISEHFFSSHSIFQGWVSIFPLLISPIKHFSTSPTLLS